MSSSPDEQAKGGLPGRLDRAMDRRAFLSTSALLGLGFAAGCSGIGRDWKGVVAGPSMLEAVPDGNARALEIFNSSDYARPLAAWLEEHALRQEPERALLFDVPDASELTEIKAEERPSLIGESAYKTFQNDEFARSRFTEDQMASISSVARVESAASLQSPTYSRPDCPRLARTRVMIGR